jgi:hypothetical protein
MAGDVTGRDRKVNFVATQPAKGRSSKSKAKPDNVTEAEIVAAPQADAERMQVDMAMPPPSITAPPGVPNTVASAPKPEPVGEPKPEAPAASATPVSRPPRQQLEKRKSVFFPMLLGGLMAGGIGYGVAYTQLGQTAPVDIEGLQSRIDALQAQVDSVPTVDLSGVKQDVATLGQGVADLSSSVGERFSALNDSIAEAGQQAPLMGKQAQEQAVAQLSDQIASQQAALEQQRADLQAQLDATRAEAEQIQQTAVVAAREQTARAALARVQGAIESGAPMREAIDDLASTLNDPLPDALTAVVDGVPALASLRDSFPEASRAALFAARSAGEAGDDVGGVGSFLRNQLNVRSVAPRDGTSADATLSRAEDALRNGRLNDALAEIATLPTSARVAMSDWTTQAEARAAAVDAADQLDASLTAN